MAKAKTIDPPAVPTLGAVLADEIKAQGLSLNAVVRRSLSLPDGARRVHLSRLVEITNGTTADPSFGTVLAILAALGKSLTWLDRQLKEGADQQ